MTTFREPDTVKLLSASWGQAGNRAPVAASPSSPNRCCLPGCESIPFVELKTVAGVRSLCLRHFQSVQGQKPTARP